MGIKKIVGRILIILLPVAFLNLSCWECILPRYQFSVPFQITPEKDSVNVGDTLWLKLSTPAKMTDLYSGNPVDFSDSPNMGASIGVDELLPGALSDAVVDFDYIFKSGYRVPVEKIVEGRVITSDFQTINDRYEIAIGFICKTKGLFLFVVPGAPHVTSRKHGSCGYAGISYPCANQDAHLNYLKDTYYQGAPLHRIDSLTSYCFKVK